jgi:hypothetical protein
MSGQDDQHRANGEDTADLGARYAATAPVITRKRPWYETSSAEEHVRTRGRWLIISGLAFGALTFIIATIWDKGFTGEMPLAYLLPLYGISFGGVAIGGMEYLSRPTRYGSALCLHRINELERQTSVLVGLLDEQLKQQYYLGMAEGARIRPPQMTGTEHSGTFTRDRSGDVLRFRRR